MIVDECKDLIKTILPRESGITMFPPNAQLLKGLFLQGINSENTIYIFYNSGLSIL